MVDNLYPSYGPSRRERSPAAEPDDEPGPRIRHRIDLGAGYSADVVLDCIRDGRARLVRVHLRLWYRSEPEPRADRLELIAWPQWLDLVDRLRRFTDRTWEYFR